MKKDPGLFYFDKLSKDFGVDTEFVSLCVMQWRHVIAIEEETDYTQFNHKDERCRIFLSPQECVLAILPFREALKQWHKYRAQQTVLLHN